MCKYCECKTQVGGGRIGARIGGRAKPIHIMEFDEKDVFDGQVWIVEREDHTYKNDDRVRRISDYHRAIDINFCPICGRHLTEIRW